MSGNSFNEIQPANKAFIFSTLLISHFDISGKEIKFLHSKKSPNIFYSTLIYQVFLLPLNKKILN